MLQRKIIWAVGSAIGLACWAAMGSVSGAEYRTSVQGKTVVRRAAYQTADTTSSGSPTLAQPVPEGATIPHAAAPPVTNLPETVIDPMMTGSPMGTAGGDCLSGDCATGDCEGSCQSSCFNACPGGTYWGSFEFLLWWRKNQDLPPLVTTSPSDTDVDLAGVLGQATTQLLYPTEEQGSDARPGARATLGVWIDPCQFCGLGGRYFTLGAMTSNFGVDSNTFPVLARPFFNLTLSEEDADVVAYPGSTVGTILVRSDSDVGGGDVFFRRLLLRDDCRRVDVVAGYQFATIDSEVLITSRRQSIRQQGSIPYGTVIDMSDSFDSTNRYHAGEIGLLAEYSRPNITWSLLAKVGLGNMKQRTVIAGQTVTAVPDQNVVTTNVGLLALGTNVGVYDQNRFAVSPELQLSAAYHLNDHVDVTCGYSFLYWNHVVQASQEIDTVINTTQLEGTLVGDARPAFFHQDSGYFVQGLNFGVQFTW
jgi:hypothetical protein